MKVLSQDIKNHTFKPVYCLYGEEAFLKKSFKNQLKTAIIGEDTMNFQSFYGKDVDVPEIISLADTMPFFAEKRLILVENSGLFKKDAEPLASYLSGMPDSTILIFVEEQVDKRNKLYKKVKELGYAAELSRQPESQLKTWILRILKQEGRQISQTAMELLLSSVGDDMEHIRTELEKLLAYTEGREGITPADVEAVCSVQITGRIFDMITDIAARRQTRALEKYYDLMALKEPPMRILFLIARQFNQLLIVKELAASGRGKDEIAKKAGIQPFVASKAMAQAKSFRTEELRDYVVKCVEAEEAVKTGRLADSLAVELLITEFSRGKS
ncbi:DNA polymerase III subunit delta [Qiania dongpingensis]|uniref:DNA polymerase III subunit delta n=1 Tax=Qiania dongpingensis TaxID=2763669 RepID=A0A7G9G6H0_9FIRM|nr:DNA polymerase III subunit delta [Qiania dongpingensis]QNM06402.1 DNA polymerase III subunit delta [Qiania dongpingensis]